MHLHIGLMMHVPGTCTSMIGRQAAAADPPVMYDAMRYIWPCLACTSSRPRGKLSFGGYRGRNQITIIVAKLVNICAPKRSNKSLLFSLNTIFFMHFIFAEV